MCAASGRPRLTRPPSRKLQHRFRVYDLDDACGALDYVPRPVICGRPVQQSGSAKRNRPGNNQHFISDTHSRGAGRLSQGTGREDQLRSRIPLVLPPALTPEVRGDAPDTGSSSPSIANLSVCRGAPSRSSQLPSFSRLARRWALVSTWTRRKMQAQCCGKNWNKHKLTENESGGKAAALKTEQATLNLMGESLLSLSRAHSEPLHSRPVRPTYGQVRSGQVGSGQGVRAGQVLLGSGQFWLGNNKRRKAPVFPSSQLPRLLPACTASTPPHQTTKRRPESERMLHCMLEAAPQFEGSFQLHYSVDRGRPVVCKESTAHHHHHRYGTAKHSAAPPQSTAQHSPQRLLSFFFSA